MLAKDTEAHACSSENCHGIFNVHSMASACCGLLHKSLRLPQQTDPWLTYIAKVKDLVDLNVTLQRAKLIPYGFSIGFNRVQLGMTWLRRSTCFKPPANSLSQVTNVWELFISGFGNVMIQCNLL